MQTPTTFISLEIISHRCSAIKVRKLEGRYNYPQGKSFRCLPYLLFFYEFN